MEKKRRTECKIGEKRTRCKKREREERDEAGYERRKIEQPKRIGSRKRADDGRKKEKEGKDQKRRRRSRINT